MGAREPTWSDLSSKMTTLPKKARDELLKKVALLYTIMTSPETPAWVKLMIVAALIYFITPLDAVPDAIPIAGLADDLAVLATTLASVAEAASRPSVQKRASDLVSRFSSRASP